MKTTLFSLRASPKWVDICILRYSEGIFRYRIIGISNIEADSGEPIICYAKEVTALYRKHRSKNRWSQKDFENFMRERDIVFELKQ